MVQLLLFVLGFIGYSWSQNEGIPLRYLSMNVGNAVIAFGCWEDKLCDPTVRK